MRFRYAVAVATLTAACTSNGEQAGPTTTAKARLTARPQTTVTSNPAPGYYTLNVTPTKDAVLYVPTSTTASTVLPLVVMLHGAGGTTTTIEQIYDLGERNGFAVIAPRSRGTTWDLTSGAIFTTDVPYIDKALEATFARIKVNASRIALAGFSDGASYSLSLGISNGDLFTHIIAFSPGFMTDPGRTGKPAFFLAHGYEDTVLPEENTERNIVPYLKSLGYAVRFDPFTGGHRVDSAEAQRAADWFLGK